MAIPAEQGLVKHYTRTFSTADPQTIAYTVEGGIGDVDLSPQLQGQGVAVFVDNQLDTNVTIDIYANVKIYGETFKVYLGSFTVASGSDGGMSAGFGLLKQGLEVVVTPDSAPASAADVVVAIVPSNG